MFDIDTTKAQQLLKSFQLPVKPDILAKIQQEESKPEPSASVFADIITQDLGLSSAVLKAINSPVFGLKRTITDIRQSVILLGCKNISNLVSFFELQKAFNKPSAISNESFWETTVDIANIMTLIIEHLSLKSVCPIEDAYAFGLFRDCGMIIMAQKYPNYAQIITDAESDYDRVFTDVEEVHYPVNHAVLGYYISNSWHLPKTLCNLILRHHELSLIDSNDMSQEQKTLYAVANIATNIHSHITKFTDYSEWNLSREKVLSLLRLSDYELNEMEEEIKEAFTHLYE
jgi:HD-like signal output (HDOD) protein